MKYFTPAQLPAPRFPLYGRKDAPERRTLPMKYFTPAQLPAPRFPLYGRKDAPERRTLPMKYFTPAQLPAPLLCFPGTVGRMGPSGGLYL